MEIRKVTQQDINGLKEVLDSSELFPSEYLDDMIADYFNNPATEEIWFAATDSNMITAFGYCTPEKLTDGTFNLLAIAVRKECQRKGIGKRLMGFIEQLLKENNKRLLIVETSSDEQFDLTRKFYLRLDYLPIAVIKDFWQEGEDKIVFWKKLN
jgi:ribosomal protein S18 acetylase RimI-like enzyme